jgi:putative transposase
VYNTRQAVALIRIAVEVKTRTRLVGVFPNETSAQTLATKIVLSSSEEEWALKCYLMMDVLKTVEEPKPQLSRP